jgi:pre-mRNA-processing factor 19
VFKDHAKEVSEVSQHADGKHFASTSLDNTYCIYDINASRTLTRVESEGGAMGPVGLTCGKWHPDGLIFTVGTSDAFVRVWEMRASANVASFQATQGAGAVTGISFSENGYFCASACSDGVHIWDFRKLKEFQHLTPSASGFTTCCAFDHSGKYLAVGAGQDVAVYEVSKAEVTEVKLFQDVAKKAVQSVKWGTDAKSLLIGTQDHNLRIYGST